MPALSTINKTLIKELRTLGKPKTIKYIYNPLEYASNPSLKFMRVYGAGPKKVVFLGMNPGPWGMGQTGVPFGDPEIVRKWMGIQGTVTQPENQHPKRPVIGMNSTRKEASGTRVWSWAQDKWGDAPTFFSDHFVLNYCPLMYFDEDGKNITPDKLPQKNREALFKICDRALVATVKQLKSATVIAFGRFAEDRALNALADQDLRILRILHPSPASPQANKGWARQATAAMEGWGLL